MKTSLLCLLTLLATSALSVEAAAPANDHFSRATPLTGRYVKLLNQTGVGSTAEALDPNMQGVKPTRTVWYRIDGGTNLAGNINYAELRLTDRAGMSVGLFRQLDREAGQGGLFLINENANTTVNDTEFFSFGTQPNEPLYLCVSANGSFDLELKLASADCDFFGQLPVQSGPTLSLTKNLSYAVPPTDEGDSPPADQLPQRLHSGMWVTWNPSFTGTAVMDTSFSSLSDDAIPADTQMAVYTGSDLASLVKVAEDNASGYQEAACVTMPVTAGTLYHLWIGRSEDSLPMQKLELRCYQSGTPGQVMHSAESVYAYEDQGSGQFRIRRMGGNAAVGATLDIGGSATNGSDYTIANTVVSFPAGHSDASYMQTVTVQILQDNVRDDAESISYALTAATGGASLQSRTRSMFIYDRTIGAQGYFEFDSSAPLVVKESDGQIILPIQSTLPSTQWQYFKVVGANDSAVLGQDFDLSGGAFLIGGGINRYFMVRILQDENYEGLERFRLIGYTQAEGGEYIATTEQEILIEDDEVVVPKAGRGAINFYSASVQFAVLSTGSLSGRVVTSSGKFSFTGRLNSAGQFVTVVGPSSGVRYRLFLRQIDGRGTYEVGLAPSTQPLLWSHLETVTLTTYSSTSPCPSAGLYTVLENSGNLPGDIPYAAVASLQVDKLGTAKLTGRLFDGTTFTASSYVNASAVCNLGASLFGGKGRILAALGLPTAVMTRRTGDGYLIKPGRANQTLEARSIVNSLSWEAVRYTPPAKNQRLLSLWNPPTIGLAELPAPYSIIQRFNVSTANKVSFTGTRDARLTSLNFTPATGLFTGGVRAMPTSSIRSYFGVVHQLGTWENQSGGYGFVPHPVTPTSVRLGRDLD